MKNFLDFLESSEDAKVLELLRCSCEEAKILQHLLKEYFKDQAEIRAIEILRALAGSHPAQILKMLPLISNLMHLGLISSNSPAREVSSLELLHSHIALSSHFFRLLESGDDRGKAKIVPYVDQNDYLRDEFLAIALLQEISIDTLSKKVGALKSKLADLKSDISKRLAMTKKPLGVIEILKSFGLSESERTIFLALLRDEYTGSDELRDLNSLIDLISKDEYERIKNRVILDDKSTLITKRILDYEIFAGSATRLFYINPEILERIFHSGKRKSKLELSRLMEDHEIFEVITPKRSLGDVILPQSTRDTIDSLLKQIDPKVMALLKAWGIKDKKTLDARIIFYGKSGTGKSLTALAIARELKREVLSLDCSKVLSMYVGESEKNVRKIFDSYKEIATRFKNPPILLLDEADQFLSLRGASGSGAEKMHNQMQNIFLEQIEKFEGILIATTNLLETIDFAFSRRFNYKIEFKLPSATHRCALWDQYLPKNASYIDTTREEVAKQLSEYALTGGQIALISKNVAYKIASSNQPVFRLSDFTEGALGELNSSFGEEKNMGFKL